MWFYKLHEHNSVSQLLAGSFSEINTRLEVLVESYLPIAQLSPSFVAIQYNVFRTSGIATSSSDIAVNDL